MGWFHPIWPARRRKCDDGGMTDSWVTAPVADVRPGDQVRLASGREMLVSRIEPNFLGREAMVAFIEDTPERWFKQPVQQAAEVEIRRPAPAG
jgi:hypothetical protein